jgi:hypothetical protein
MIDQFHVGQRVVCINDRYERYFCEWADEFPVKGRVYTVKKLKECPDGFTQVVGLGLHLEELKNSESFFYTATRFVPVALTEVAVEELMAVG